MHTFSLRLQWAEIAVGPEVLTGAHQASKQE